MHYTVQHPRTDGRHQTPTKIMPSIFVLEMIVWRWGSLPYMGWYWQSTDQQILTLCMQCFTSTGRKNCYWFNILCLQLLKSMNSPSQVDAHHWWSGMLANNGASSPCLSANQHWLLTLLNSACSPTCVTVLPRLSGHTCEYVILTFKMSHALTVWSTYPTNITLPKQGKGILGRRKKPTTLSILLCASIHTYM